MSDAIPATALKEPTKAQIRDALWDVINSEDNNRTDQLIIHLQIARSFYRAYPDAVTGDWPPFILSLASVNPDYYGDCLEEDDALIGEWKVLEPGGLEIFMAKARELAKQRLEEARSAQSTT